MKKLRINKEFLERPPSAPDKAYAFSEERRKSERKVERKEARQVEKKKEMGNDFDYKEEKRQKRKEQDPVYKKILDQMMRLDELQLDNMEDTCR